MGMASRLAAKYGKTRCDRCGKPFSTEIRPFQTETKIARFSYEPPEAICRWCDFELALKGTDLTLKTNVKAEHERD